MRRQLEPVSEHIPNLAPMVDVIMVLLVFFLLGASLQLAPEGMLQTELDPSSGPGAGAAVQIHPLIRIGLQDDAQGQAARVYLLNEALPGGFDQLRQVLEQRRAAGADPRNPVVIGAEQSVRWRFVVAAMDAAVQAGFANVQFAVSLPDSPSRAQ